MIATISNTCLRRHHSQSNMGNQPSNLESILVKVQILYDLNGNSQGLSITVDTAFRKDLTLQGCTNFNHQYHPAPCLILQNQYPRPRRLQSHDLFFILVQISRPYMCEPRLIHILRRFNIWIWRGRLELPRTDDPWVRLMQAKGCNRARSASQIGRASCRERV